MTESKKTPGPPKIDDVYGETFTDYRFKLPESQLEHVRIKATEQRISMAEYLRRLIAADMPKPD